jgi:hypothetical protein
MTTRDHAWRVRAALAVAAFLLVWGGYASAQFGRSVTRGVRMAPDDMPDRRFAICRIMFEQVRTGAVSGAGWRTDYPLGENNLMIRFAELTRARISMDSARRPNHWVVRLTDDALFNCPYVVASDVGTMGLSDEEIANFRKYLVKGGFLWVDDFWGDVGWEYWSRLILTILPGRTIEEVGANDPIFQGQFAVRRLIQVPNYPSWSSSGGSTSELGELSRNFPYRVIRDDEGRIMVLMTHNNDLADSWEREGEDPVYFQTFSVEGYAIGINVLLYALTH